MYNTCVNETSHPWYRRRVFGVATCVLFIEFSMSRLERFHRVLLQCTLYLTIPDMGDEDI